MQSLSRKARGVVLVTVAVSPASVLTLLGFLRAWSPGRLTPFRDEDGKALPGSVSEKVRVDINGTETGEDRASQAV